MGRPIIDLSGRVYGRLTVVAITAERHGTNTVWECVCVCGTTCYASALHLKSGSIKSCGCLPKSKKRRTSHVLRSTGQYTLNQKLRIRYTQYRLGAEERGYRFDLTPERFIGLLQQPCHYCGLSPDSFAGVDRVDNVLGYAEENVVACCKDCNLAKGTRNATEFVAWAKRVAEHCRDLHP